MQFHEQSSVQFQQGPIQKHCQRFDRQSETCFYRAANSIDLVDIYSAIGMKGMDVVFLDQSHLEIVRIFPPRKGFSVLQSSIKLGGWVVLFHACQVFGEESSNPKSQCDNCANDIPDLDRDQIRDRTSHNQS